MNDGEQRVGAVAKPFEVMFVLEARIPVLLSFVVGGHGLGKEGEVPGQGKEPGNVVVVREGGRGQE